MNVAQLKPGGMDEEAVNATVPALERVNKDASEREVTATLIGSIPALRGTFPSVLYSSSLIKIVYVNQESISSCGVLKQADALS